MTAAADGRGGAGLGAGAATGRAWSRKRHAHGDLAALHSLLERHVHVGLQVAPSLRPRRTPGGRAPEEVRDDVAEATEAATGACPAAAWEAAAEEAAAGVVLLALLRVGQDRVRALHLLEALLRRLVALVRVRVVLAGKLAVGLLDLVVRGLLVDAERPVGVGHRRHQPETTTRAGRRIVPFER